MFVSFCGIRLVLASSHAIHSSAICAHIHTEEVRPDHLNIVVEPVILQLYVCSLGIGIALRSFRIGAAVAAVANTSSCSACPRHMAVAFSMLCLLG